MAVLAAVLCLLDEGGVDESTPPDLCDESTMPCVHMRGVYTRDSESIPLEPWHIPGCPH